MLIEKVKDDLNKYSDPEKAKFHLGFFKTGPGEYGDGDQFLGIKVPDQRKVAKRYYRNITLEDIESLLRENIHEYRLTALIMLVYKYEKAKTEQQQKEIVDLYLKNVDYVNNWDLVDTSAYNILGAYLINKDKDILYEFAKSNHLWKQRISIISTLYFIKRNKFKDTFEMSKILLNHEHDLIHKAVGWMLREVGKKDLMAEVEFLKKYYKIMPRTALRYAIERFEPELRIRFLKGLI